MKCPAAVRLYTGLGPVQNNSQLIYHFSPIALTPVLLICFDQDYLCSVLPWLSLSSLCLQLDVEKLQKIPILKKLQALEEEAGKDVTLGSVPATVAGTVAAAEPAPRAAQPRRQTRRRPRLSSQQEAEEEFKQESKPERKTEGEQNFRQRPARVRKDSRGGEERATKGRGRGGNFKEKGPDEKGSEGTASERKVPPTVTTVYLGGIPTGLRVSELKTVLREKDAVPLRLTWQGAQHRAFLDYSDPEAADQALEALQGLNLDGQGLQAELAKSQRRGRRSGQSDRRPGPGATQKFKTSTTEEEVEKSEQWNRTV